MLKNGEMVNNFSEKDFNRQYKFFFIIVVVADH